jgi:hypothetical protein
MATTLRLILAAQLAATIVAGCASQTPGPDTANPCEFGAVAFDVGPVDLCEQAIALAEARLGWLHWPITSVRFRQDMCPPNARCVALARTEAWVVFTFSMGDPSMVHLVADATGALSALNPESPPDWLLEEIRQQDPSRPAEPQDAGG